MPFQFDGNFLVGGQGYDELQTIEEQLCWGRLDQNKVVGGIIDKDTVDSGHSGATDILRPGLCLGRITATKQITHWDPYATDGSNQLYGVLGLAQNMQLYGTAYERFVGMILLGGNLRADAILIGGQASAGISGTNYEILLREQMQNKFVLDDDWGNISAWKQRDLGANATLTVADHNTHFTNLSATGSITLTLPQPIPGFRIRVSCTTGQNIVLGATGGDSDYLLPGGSAASDTLTAANGETIDVYTVRTAATPVFQYVLSPVPA